MINNKADNYIAERKQAIATLKTITHRFGAELTRQADSKAFVDEESAAIVSAYTQAQTALLALLKEELE